MEYHKAVSDISRRLSPEIGYQSLNRGIGASMKLVIALQESRSDIAERVSEEKQFVY